MLRLRRKTTFLSEQYGHVGEMVLTTGIKGYISIESVCTNSTLSLLRMRELLPEKNPVTRKTRIVCTPVALTGAR